MYCGPSPHATVSHPKPGVLRALGSPITDGASAAVREIWQMLPSFVLVLRVWKLHSSRV